MRNVEHPVGRRRFGGERPLESANGVVEVLKGLQENEVVASAGSFLMKTEILKSNIGAGCCEVDTGR